MLMSATRRLPSESDPNEYVVARLRAPAVAPRGIPPGLLAQKYQLPYVPATVVWMVALSHSETQYPANVTNTTRPMTFPLEHPPSAQAGFGLLLELPGIYET